MGNPIRIGDIKGFDDAEVIDDEPKEETETTKGGFYTENEQVEVLMKIALLICLFILLGIQIYRLHRGI